MMKIHRVFLPLTPLAAVFLVILLILPKNLPAQDTISVSFKEFSVLAKEASARLDAHRKNVSLAENQIKQAQSNRILPGLSLSTAHGLVPGVKPGPGSKLLYGSGSYYLDPTLENDWENWGIFTQAEISGIQPIYTWGAIRNAVKAAQKGADAARHQFESQKESYTLQLYELYQSALLALEMERLMKEADSQLQEAEKELKRLREEADPSLEERDVFEFYIFKEEFKAVRTEAYELKDFIQRAWHQVLSAHSDVKYQPKERFLDPVSSQIQDLASYKSHAVKNREELKGITAAGEAANYGVSAMRSQRYPALVLGFYAGFGYTPNRPRQNNPFIRNNTNFLSARVGFGIQQNLNFLQINNRIERSEIQKRQMRDFYDAALQGIFLEVDEQYRKTKTIRSQRESKRNALRISNEWLRTEQIDFDIGFGDVKNLVDALKKKMELEIEIMQLTFNLNIQTAKLYRSAGIPIFQLIPDTNH